MVYISVPVCPADYKVPSTLCTYCTVPVRTFLHEFTLNRRVGYRTKHVDGLRINMTSSSMKNQWIFVLLNREKDEEITLNEFCADFKHFFDENVAQNEIFIPSNENPLNLEMRRDGEFNISLKENFADFIENCDEIGSDEEEEDDGDTFYPILAQTTRNFFIEVKIIGEKVENCEHFWLNPASSFAAYNRFLMNLNAFYYDTGKLSRCGPNFVIRNYHYAVKIGQLWRRGRAKTCDGENGFYLIDEGGFRSYEEISEVKKLRPKFAEFPAQAFKCGLNIKEPEIARLNAVRFKGIVSELRMCGRKIEANIIKRSTERNFQCPSLIVELAKVTS